MGRMIVNIVVENTLILFDEELDLLAWGNFHVLYNYLLIKQIDKMYYKFFSNIRLTKVKFII